MKRFQFRLDTLLALRKRREEQVKLELGKKNQEISRSQEELKTFIAALKTLQSSEKEKRAEHQETILELRYSVAYRFKLKQDIIKKGSQVEELGVQAAGIKKRLVKATQARRALELLREKKLSEWKKEYNTTEQGFIDDVSEQAFIRKTKSAKAIEVT
jgi:flagellar protein FliJ